MMKRLCLIDLPGLSGKLLNAIPAGSALGGWLSQQRVATLLPSWPAVTSSVQATLTTGVEPSVHGIIANGIATYRSTHDQSLIDASNFADYRRDVSFWEQSNQLVEAPRFWQDETSKSRFKTALLFFQQSMPGFQEPTRPAADIVLTPKPEHGPDGKLTSLCWSSPPELIGELTQVLGPFPLMNYWGPLANIKSSEWIARAATHVWDVHRPTLQLTYVPHLDYDLQRFGPDSPQAIRAVEDVAAAIEPLIQAVLASGSELLLVSEYAISAVRRSIAPNRILADAGLLATRSTPDGRLVDYRASAAFAMVDHQIGHVYVRDQSDLPAVRDALNAGGLNVLEAGSTENRHRRSGELLVESPPDAWLDYRWWESVEEAPMFATSVDIHRKPGYDPLELFMDMATRTTSQDASRIKGSHGRLHQSPTFADSPAIAGALRSTAPKTMRAAGVAELVLKTLTE